MDSHTFLTAAIFMPRSSVAGESGDGIAEGREPWLGMGIGFGGSPISDFSVFSSVNLASSASNVKSSLISEESSPLEYLNASLKMAGSWMGSMVET